MVLARKRGRAFRLQSPRRVGTGCGVTGGTRRAPVGGSASASAIHGDGDHGFIPVLIGFAREKSTNTSPFETHADG